MQLNSVLKKKIWDYSYSSVEEMNIHLKSMESFHLESIDKINLTASFSQIISSQNIEDIKYKEEDKQKKIEASLMI